MLLPSGAGHEMVQREIHHQRPSRLWT